MLYCAVKTGININIADLGLNVFYDLIDYASELDAVALAKADGKNIHYTTPMSIAEMTQSGKLRG